MLGVDFHSPSRSTSTEALGGPFDVQHTGIQARHHSTCAILSFAKLIFAFYT